MGPPGRGWAIYLTAVFTLLLLIYPVSAHGGNEDDCECEGQVTFLNLLYSGNVPALITVRSKRGTLVFFNGNVNPGEDFSFVGDPNKRNKMGPDIDIFLNGGFHVRLHTSCSQPIFTGLVFGQNPSFTILNGQSHGNGPFCPLPCTVAEDCVQPSNPCRKVRCVDDMCLERSRRDGTNCSDSIFCDGPESCWDGECASDNEPPCNQNEECIEEENRCVPPSPPPAPPTPAPPPPVPPPTPAPPPPPSMQCELNDDFVHPQILFRQAVCLNGMCLERFRRDGTNCSDIVFCDGPESCWDGECLSENDPPCNQTQECIEEENRCASTNGTMMGGECGNGVFEAGEQCDDGNLVSGDGCDTQCRIEPGHDCDCSADPCVCITRLPPLHELTTLRIVFFALFGILLVGCCCLILVGTASPRRREEKSDARWERRRGAYQRIPTYA